MMNDYVRYPDLRILETLCRLARAGGKTWCAVSYPTLQESVLAFTLRWFSTRALRQHLGALERDGWICRRRQHHTKVGFSPTCYVMTDRAWSWAAGEKRNLERQLARMRSSRSRASTSSTSAVS